MNYTAQSSSYPSVSYYREGEDEPISSDEILEALQQADHMREVAKAAGVINQNSIKEFQNSAAGKVIKAVKDGQILQSLITRRHADEGVIAEVKAFKYSDGCCYAIAIIGPVEEFELVKIAETLFEKVSAGDSE